MSHLAFADPEERIRTLSEMFAFTGGEKGCAIQCRQCNMAWWYPYAKPRTSWLTLLELMRHADGHPSF